MDSIFLSPAHNPRGESALCVCVCGLCCAVGRPRNGFANFARQGQARQAKDRQRQARTGERTRVVFSAVVINDFHFGVLRCLR
jgi:hypothetical protein